MKKKIACIFLVVVLTLNASTLIVASSCNEGYAPWITNDVVSVVRVLNDLGYEVDLGLIRRHSYNPALFLVSEEIAYCDYDGSQVIYRLYVDNVAVGLAFAYGIEPLSVSGSSDFERTRTQRFNNGTAQDQTVTVWFSGRLNFDNANPRTATITNMNSGVRDAAGLNRPITRSSPRTVEDNRGNNTPFTRAFATFTVTYRFGPSPGTITSAVYVTVSGRGYSDGQITS